MFNFLNNFHFDRLSFWLGFIAASLLWWLYTRIRPLMPYWREQLRQYMEAISMRNLAGVEDYLRREVLRQAQHQHLAAPLFALDEILIQPWLILPPGGEDPEVIPTNRSIAADAIPYLPDWPELVAPFGVPAITPLQALQSERHLAFIGQPGSGRTVALSQLASQLSRRGEELGKYQAALPIFMHALDLETTLAEGQDPTTNLVKAVVGSASVVMQPQIPRFIESVFRDKARKVVLLLDGLDELTPDGLSATVDYLKALLKKQPRMQIITTASADYVDGLTKANFYPLAIAAWTQNQRMDLAKKWGALWAESIFPTAQKQAASLNPIDPVLMDYWLSSETGYLSPLEWTVRIWGAYAGDLSGDNSLSVLDSYLSRFLPNPSYAVALEELAHYMVYKPATSLSFTEMEKFLSGIKIAQPVAFAEMAEAGAAIPNTASEKPGKVEATGEPSTFPADAVESNGAEVSVSDESSAKAETSAPAEKASAPGKKAKKKGSKRDSLTTQGEEIIDALLKGGVLIELHNHQIRFANPVFLGFLAGLHSTPEEVAEMAKQVVEKANWSTQLIVLQYAAACSDNPDWVFPLISGQSAPLFRNLLIAARWLRDAPSSAEWRTQVMRNLVGIIQNETLSLGVRARMIAAFYLSRDPSTARLFKQLLGSKSATVRRAALMGCAAFGSAQLINDILPLLADSEAVVRNTAALTLAAMPSEAALNAVVQVLLSGDEDIRQAAAEALAQNKRDGHQVLKEAAEVDDLLTRRAAVFGLMQVHEPWAREFIEKMAIQDGQWVVRNAAGQALEVLQQTVPAIPKPLPRPSDSPWLITFASKLGLGLTPGQPATDVLLAVLKSGSIEEQIAALYYLREQSDEGVAASLYGMYYSGVSELHEPTLHALWWMAITGVKLPNPIQYGLG